ncbi:MAG: hypothetical protein LBD10_00400 [Desulfobulbus sp.]|jgi:hypothetical protein|uniref:hypothetical protein n=1 Tax=Desulfobulbus sp. TaxID=895 RepID=UPI0028441E96|nr:hypothetical protein [Desulfobulbus sp.]MDR2548662.1 hypothetical protein [Desulfobulbus sp.]
MTMMIGIHQQQDKVDKLYENLGLRAAPLTAVGPFSSKDEALAWQRSMQKKTDDCQIVDMGAADNPDSPWYGFFFER